MTIRLTYTLALLQAILLTAILILNPWWSAGGRDTSVEIVKKPETDGPPIIIHRNLTAADMVGRYDQTTENYTTTPPTGISFLEEVEQLIVNLTNEQRQNKKLPELQLDTSLRTAARSHSVDMLERDFFDHTSPDGYTPFDRIAIIHRTLIGTVGENIWSGQGFQQNDAKQLTGKVVKDWLGSPGHRDNLLRDNYTHIGVGVASKGDLIRITQNFASVQAWFQEALPLDDIKQGGKFSSLATRPELQKTPPVKYEYWLSDKGVAAKAPLDITDTQIKIEPGTYRLRLYFETVADKKTSKKGVTSYVIYSGPQVVVNKE